MNSKNLSKSETDDISEHIADLPDLTALESDFSKLKRELKKLDKSIYNLLDIIGEQEEEIEILSTIIENKNEEINYLIKSYMKS